MELTPAEARILGCLVEKQLTTPQQYPLTMAVLLAACNQTTNRDPIVTYDEDEVTGALDGLKQLHLCRAVLPSHGRSVVRYRHVLDEAWGLDSRQCAVLSVLLLRGPQTVGELRTRTERMAEFDGLGAVEHELDFLAAREQPLAANTGRSPGQKEERWACPLVGVVPAAGPGPGPAPAPAPTPARATASTPASDGLADLRADLDALRQDVARLRRQFDALRSSLGEEGLGEESLGH
ncbi:MAG TPA: YceH family protein [Acidimicrobiales bacterium]|nr:YceH family protein [Acidimicrobiales bacterium]